MSLFPSASFTAVSSFVPCHPGIARKWFVYALCWWPNSQLSAQTAPPWAYVIHFGTVWLNGKFGINLRVRNACYESCIVSETIGLACYTQHSRHPALRVYRDVHTLVFLPSLFLLRRGAIPHFVATSMPSPSFRQ